MKVDALILQLAIVFLPGIIWARIDSKYALTAKPSDTEFILRAFVFGICSYAITFGIYSALKWEFVFVNFNGSDISSIANRAVALEILIAAVVGLACSIVWVYAATYKWLSRFLQKIKATKKYGDEDVWDFMFNSTIANVEYVHFRDLENKLVYAGWVRTFSETDKLRELVLRDVEVYDFEGKKLYSVPLMYLAKEPKNIQIDFPYQPDQSGDKA